MSENQEFSQITEKLFRDYERLFTNFSFTNSDEQNLQIKSESETILLDLDNNSFPYNHPWFSTTEGSKKKIYYINNFKYLISLL